MNTPPPHAPAAGPPAPRRTRDGAVVIGPSVGARYLPGALLGLPLLAVVLSPFGGAALQQWRHRRVLDGHDGLLERVLDPAWAQLLLGALLLWLVFALWAVVPLLLTHRVVLFDEAAGTLALRRGVRIAERARLGDVRFATGDAERGGMALIGLERPERQWVVPESGWDEESFDGLRVLQAAAGLRPAPPRHELVGELRRGRRIARDRELADRLGMPWRPEYEADPLAFQAEFDRVRRVLGGKEPRRDGDPEI